MNICMFTNTYLPHVGGVARSVDSFAEDLRKRGNNVLIVAPTFPGSSPSSDKGNVLRVPAIQNFNGSDFSVRIPIPFFTEERIDSFNPDVIHSHHPFLLGDAAIRAAYRRNLPLVFTHHTLYEQYTHYVSSDSEIMQQLAINLSTEYANHCTRVIAPSESIGSLIAARGVTSPVEVIPTGIDVDHFQSGDGDNFRQAHDIQKDVFVLGHLGRLAPEKNLDYLCDSVIHAMRKSSQQLRFLVVGTGRSEARIAEKFEEAGLAQQLIMVGKKEGTDLVDAYNAMDLFVFSSKSETQGMVLAEAMSASLPVIALDASGAREVVQDKENGRLLPAETSPEGFADAILEGVDQCEQTTTWRKAALQRAYQFSRETTADTLEKLYQKVRQDQQHNPTESHDSGLDPWDELIHSLRTEWEILSGKANALMNSLQKGPAQK